MDPAIHCVHTWLFDELPYGQLAEALTRNDFHADLSLRHEGLYTPEKLMREGIRELKSRGLEITVCTPLLFSEALDLSSPDEKIRTYAFDFFCRCADAAAACGVQRMLFQPSPVVKNPQYHISRDADWDTAVNGARRLAEYAAKNGVRLLLEPVNRYRVSLVHTVSEALQFLRDMDVPGAGIIPDTYHMNMEDPEGVVEELAAAGDALQGIHIGGRTRKMPGQDNTDWHRFAAFLRGLGRAIPLCYEPHYLYFEPKRVAGDETYRSAFLSELTRGRDYLSTLIEKEI